MKYKTLFAYLSVALFSLHDVDKAHGTAVLDVPETREIPQTIQDVIQEIQSVELSVEDVKLRLEQESNDAVKNQLHRTLILLIKRLSLLKNTLYDLKGKEFSMSYTPSLPPLGYLDWESEFKVLALPQEDAQHVISRSLEWKHKIAILRKAILKIQTDLPSFSEKDDIELAEIKIHRLREELEFIQAKHLGE
jgi:hypothetical protein